MFRPIPPPSLLVLESIEKIYIQHWRPYSNTFPDFSSKILRYASKFSTFFSVFGKCGQTRSYVFDTLHEVEGSAKRSRWCFVNLVPRAFSKGKALGTRLVFCITLVCFFRRTAYNLKTISTDRNFTGKATAIQLTNTSYQWQWLQDTFVLIQPSEMLGTVLEWKLMEPNVSCYPYVLASFPTAMPNFEPQFQFLRRCRSTLWQLLKQTYNEPAVHKQNHTHKEKKHRVIKHESGAIRCGKSIG